MYKIAITGKANSGKNTVGKLLCNGLREIVFAPKIDSLGHHLVGDLFYGMKFMAFADPIKEMIRIAYPELPRKFLYGPSKFRAEVIPGAFKNGIPLTVRQYLIDIGNGARANKPDIWLNNFDNRFNKLVKKNFSIVVVTDVRFRNEFDHLKNKDFFQIRLLRDAHLKINDVSETNQDGIDNNEFDAIIYNNRTLKDLKEEVNKIIPRLSSK
jgi:hypothetical protein